MWGTCIPGISYRMMLQTFSASNGMTPWHKSPTLGCVNSVSSRCSHVPEEHRRNHWDEEHENYTWVAMKYFLGKILKCIQFKVFKVKALRKSCVEIVSWTSCMEIMFCPCQTLKKIKVQQRLDVFELFCNLDWLKWLIRHFEQLR